MSLCPECFVKDKNFFASKCHACNSEVSFLRQCTWSFVWSVTYFSVIVGTIILIMSAING
jgi:hypothetical protein